MNSKIAPILAVLGLNLLLTACLTVPLPVQGEAPTPVDVVELPPTTASPVSTPPHLITRGETAVRTGPGLAYEPSHFLGPGTTAPILGRHVDGGWWAIHGPGDGPGQVGWAPVTAVALNEWRPTPQQ